MIPSRDLRTPCTRRVGAGHRRAGGCRPHRDRSLLPAPLLVRRPPTESSRPPSSRVGAHAHRSRPCSQTEPLHSLRRRQYEQIDSDLSEYLREQTDRTVREGRSPPHAHGTVGLGGPGLTVRVGRRPASTQTRSSWTFACSCARPRPSTRCSATSPRSVPYLSGARQSQDSGPRAHATVRHCGRNWACVYRQPPRQGLLFGAAHRRKGLLPGPDCDHGTQCP